MFNLLLNKFIYSANDCNKYDLFGTSIYINLIDYDLLNPKDFEWIIYDKELRLFILNQKALSTERYSFI